MKGTQYFLRYNLTAMIQHPDRFLHFDEIREVKTSYNIPELFQSTTELPENEDLMKIMPQALTLPHATDADKGKSLILIFSSTT
jgi:hypothetical protein